MSSRPEIRESGTASGEGCLPQTHLSSRKRLSTRGPGVRGVKLVFVRGDKLKPRVVMVYPASPYIEERNGGLYVAGTGVSLDSVVIRFQQGASPDKIVQSFPTLKLSHAYGAIAYYLENE